MRIADISDQVVSTSRTAKKIDMLLVRPRPDSETSASEFHRIAIPGQTYICPVGAKGGSNPIFGIIISAPVGTTLVTAFDPDTKEEYLYVVTPSLPAGDYTYIIRLVSQNLDETATAWWTTNCADSHFIYAAETGANGGVGNNGTGTGTKANPYQTLDGVFIDKDTTAVHTGKTVVLRSAPTQITYDAPTTYNIALGDASGKPLNIIPYPSDETMPIIDEGSGKPIQLLSANGQTIAGIDFNNSPGIGTEVQNSNFIKIGTALHRISIYGNKFRNSVLGDTDHFNEETGTASGAQTDTAGYAIGATAITLGAVGTGSIDAGDRIKFSGHANANWVRVAAGGGIADVSVGGTLTLESPGLIEAVSAATTNITFSTIFAGGDNPACIYANSQGILREYMFLANNTSDGNMTSLWQLFEVTNSLSRCNTGINSVDSAPYNGGVHNAPHGLQLKDDIYEFTSFYDDFGDGTMDYTSSVLEISLQEGITPNSNIEIVHGKFVHPTDGGGFSERGYSVGSSGLEDATDRFIYLTRCTLVHTDGFGVKDKKYTIEYDHCIAVSDNDIIPASGTWLTVVNTNSDEYIVSANPLDVNNNVPSGHADYGIKGATYV